MRERGEESDAAAVCDAIAMIKEIQLMTKKNNRWVLPSNFAVYNFFA